MCRARYVAGEGAVRFSEVCSEKRKAMRFVLPLPRPGPPERKEMTTCLECALIGKAACPDHGPMVWVAPAKPRTLAHRHLWAGQKRKLRRLAGVAFSGRLLRGRK